MGGWLLAAAGEAVITGLETAVRADVHHVRRVGRRACRKASCR
jgi:hypothetical protein